MGSPRKSSTSAVGGRMLNPSVEPTARRESMRENDGSEGKVRRSSGRPSSRESKQGSSAGRRASADAMVTQEADSSTSAAIAEARNQRRSIGLKRLSVNSHMKETLIHALEDVAREVRVGAEATGIDKLKVIMTEAKEKGLGVSNLFHFFLLQSEGIRRGSVERRASKAQDRPEDATKPDEPKHETGGGLFRDTQSSKCRAESTRNSKAGKQKSMELMPSLQKGARPSTANSKRSSGGSSSMDTDRRHSGSPTGEDHATKDGVSFSTGRRKSSISRRSSSMEEAMMQDRLITTSSFHRGLTTLGFTLSDKETEGLFQQLDTNNDGNIDLAEFTRFCLEIPSMPWKAERARRGILGNNPGVNGDRELDRVARDIANETIADGDGAGNGARGDAAAAKLEPAVDLGKVVYKGEKFFWRTKDLIDVVIQLNERKRFLAVTTFHTERLQLYPTFFVDPTKIPPNAGAEGEILTELKTRKLAAKTNLDMAGARGGEGRLSTGGKENEEASTTDQSLAEKAHIMYLTDYIVHRLSMPDESGNLLQPDVTRPEEEVNPALSEDGKHGSTLKTKRGSASRRPGLMRTTFDEWDTLLISNPPSRMEGTPQFSKTKKRESYFQEFFTVTEAFQENRIKAHRLSGEAAAFALQVSNTLAPLNHSASAPAGIHLPLHESQNNTPNLQSDDASQDGPNQRPKSGRVVLEDDISTRRESSRVKVMLESQSAPVLRQSEETVAA